LIEVEPMDPRQPKRRARGKNAPQNLPQDLPPDGGVSDFTQLALWMAASLAGMVTALLIARRPFFESLMRTVGGGAGAGAANAKKSRAGARPKGLLALRPTPEESLPMLAEAIVGNTKEAVASVFGPPRSAAVRGVVKSGKGPAFWQATTWYYPLPRERSLAMAIVFDEDAARRVEFFRAPGL
jgi:hypothetical protein